MRPVSPEATVALHDEAGMYKASGNSMNAKILLVDDNEDVRNEIRPLLERISNVEVVGEAESGEQAVELAHDLRPDMVIIDVVMPGTNGIEATRLITGEFPQIKIIGLSVYSDKMFVSGLINAGGMGYILKDCVYEELQTAIQTVIAGQIYLSPGLSPKTHHGKGILE